MREQRGDAIQFVELDGAHGGSSRKRVLAGTDSAHDHPETLPRVAGRETARLLRRAVRPGRFAEMEQVEPAFDLPAQWVVGVFRAQCPGPVIAQRPAGVEPVAAVQAADHAVVEHRVRAARVFGVFEHEQVRRVRLQARSVELVGEPAPAMSHTKARAQERLDRGEMGRGLAVQRFPLDLRYRSGGLAAETAPALEIRVRVLRVGAMDDVHERLLAEQIVDAFTARRERRQRPPVPGPSLERVGPAQGGDLTFLLPENRRELEPVGVGLGADLEEPCTGLRSERDRHVPRFVRFQHEVPSRDGGPEVVVEHFAFQDHRPVGERIRDMQDDGKRRFRRRGIRVRGGLDADPRTRRVAEKVAVVALGHAYVVDPSGPRADQVDVHAEVRAAFRGEHRKGETPPNVCLREPGLIRLDAAAVFCAEVGGLPVFAERAKPGAEIRAHYGVGGRDPQIRADGVGPACMNRDEGVRVPVIPRAYIGGTRVDDPEGEGVGAPHLPVPGPRARAFHPLRGPTPERPARSPAVRPLREGRVGRQVRLGVLRPRACRHHEDHRQRQMQRPCRPTRGEAAI